LARLISSLVVIGLLGASAAAFAVTEGLKLERSPITGTRISTAFSPTCGCPTGLARIAFRLRKADSVNATILGPDGNTVKTWRGLKARPGFLHLVWDGRDSAGTVVPQGAYRVRVHLAKRHQTITLPNKIQVDLTPPRIVITRMRPLTFSPDGDHRRDRIAVRFTVNETARPLLLVNGKKALRGRLTKGGGTLYWAGRLQGRTLPQGSYKITFRAQDVAGNRSRPTHPYRVFIRYLTLSRSVIRIAPDSRFSVRISSDARGVRWRFGGKSSFARPRTLKLRAPAKRGRYHLIVTARGHRASALVLVGRRP
jgi:hypothetical protein